MDIFPVKLEYSQEVCWICEFPDQGLHDLTVEQNGMLTLLIRIQVYQDKPPIRRLCENCIKRLNEAFRFVQQCVEAENRLQISIAQQHDVKVESEEQDEANSVECSMEIKPKLEDDYWEVSVDEHDLDVKDPQSEGGISENAVDLSDINVEVSWEKPKGAEAGRGRTKKEYRCQQCDRVFKKIDSLKNHEDAHLGIKRFSCEICGMKFVQKYCLKRHVENIHQHVKSWVCNICGHAFNEKHQLKVHEVKHITEKNFSCEQCSRKFKTAFHLGRHMAQHDPVAKVSLECDICHKTMSSASALYNHKLRHAEPGFVCSVCGKQFSSKSLWKLHMISHTDERRFECNECHATFKQEKTWREHKMIHTKVKLHRCDVCERRFRTWSQMSSHRFLHTGLRPHVCLICKKDFNRPWNLRLHMRTHEGRAPEDGKEAENAS